MTKTTQKARELFEHHLPYEIRRLAETYDLLNDTREVQRGLTLPTFDTVADSLIVSFCIHAKALIEFLSKSGGDQYASPLDYSENYEPWKIAHNSREHSIRGKLNNQLSHLTFDRTAVDLDKIGPDDRTFIIKRIKEELERWVPSLKAEFDAKFLPIARLRPALTLSVLGAISATNHTTSVSVVGWTGPSAPVTKKAGSS